MCVINYQGNSEIDNNEIYSIAAAIELFVLSLDIIDDIQDNDSENIWMEKPEQSLNISLFLINKCQSIYLNSSFLHKQKALEILNIYFTKTIQGQQLDLENNALTEKEIIHILEEKSGSLVSLSCLIGKVLRDGKAEEYYKQYSNALGVIQQINNDISSLYNNDKKNDFLNGKINLPILYIFNRYSFFSLHLLKKYQTENLALIPYTNKVEFFENTFALQYCEIIKHSFQKIAIKGVDTTNLLPHYKQYIKKFLC